ncbi:unnamed protein product [Ceutorhynchus assimilis]|uniref:BZIP domain-containing protein n=1 Tax=Ceutorhynchus assimilis TaxID=467358 RepID=A0A9N9MKY5_9CUCU|nr:unnamed protein product [Ceutorhynchus assimilis]
MSVMDLSMPKHLHPVTSYHQNPYMMPNLPMYSYPPQALIPTTSSISHLGFFQQLQYAAAAATPQIMVPQPQQVLYQPEPVDHQPQPQQNSPVYKVPQLPPIKRPFKTLAASKTSPLTLTSALDPSLDEEYEVYRNKVISRIQEEPHSHRNMRRNVPANPEKANDPEYLERRKKNNEAAKRSREARKAKEDELAIRVSFLEKENLKMKFQLAAIEREKKMIMLRRKQMQRS